MPKPNKKTLFITKFDNYTSGGASRFYTNLYPYLEKEFKLTFNCKESGIDIALLNAASTPLCDVLELIALNPKVVILNRLDSKTLKVIPINNLSHATIFQSEFCKQIYSDIINPKNYKIIYNGSNFKSLGCKTNTGVLKILHSNWSTSENKNLDVLFSLIKYSQKNENNVHIYTSGNYIRTQDFKEEYKNLGVSFYTANKAMFKKYQNVTYLGYLNPDKLMPILSSMDYLFFPGSNDACPNTVVEALRCNLPIIYHNSGGTPELVKDAGLCLSDYTTTQELICACKTNQKKLAAKAIERGLEMDFDKTAKEYMDYIKITYAENKSREELNIGWILCGHRDVGSARLGGFNIHDQFLKLGVKSTLLNYNKVFSLDIDIPLNDIIQKIEEAKCNVVFLQKVSVGKTLDVVAYCKKKGIKIIYSVGDLWDTPLYTLADLIITSSPKFVERIKKLYPKSNPIYIEDGVDYKLLGNHKTHRNSKNINIGWFGNCEKMKDLDILRPLLKPEDNLITFSNSNKATYEMGHGCKKPWNTVEMADFFLNNIDLAFLPINLKEEKNLYKSANRLTLLFYLGMPTILTPIPSYLELDLQNEQNCYLANLEDTDLWQKYLDDFRNKNSNERNLMSMRAYHTIGETFSMENVAKNYLANILKILT